MLCFVSYLFSYQRCEFRPGEDLHSGQREVVSQKAPPLWLMIVWREKLR